MQDKSSITTTLPTVVCLDRNSLPASVNLNLDQSLYRWVCYPNTSPEQMIQRCKEANVLIINKAIVGSDLLRACPNIQHIAVSATGYNVVDLDACRAQGVSVSNIPGYATTAVPEHVMMLALCLRRELLHYRGEVSNGAWASSDNFCLFEQPIQDLRDATFGVLGFGQLGQATAKLAKAMGMNVIYHSRQQYETEFADYVSFKELISQSDILSIHTSLSAETENIISTEEFVAMRSHAILINTARGGVVNEKAAALAIQSKQIAALGFDVLSQEPPINGNPLLDIADRTNVIITPHNAWASSQATQRLADILMNNVHGFLRGQAQNIVSD